jgi:hypothetical protein
MESIAAQSELIYLIKHSRCIVKVGLNGSTGHSTFQDVKGNPITNNTFIFLEWGIFADRS